MEIKDFSKKFEVSIDTLRYYDREGLLKPERIRGRRTYSEEDGFQIENIKKLKAAGLTLREIKEMYSIEGAAEIYEINSFEFIQEALRCEKIIEDKLFQLKRKELEIRDAREMLEKMLKKMESLKRGEIE